MSLAESLLETESYNWLILIVVLVAVGTIFSLPPGNDE